MNYYEKLVKRVNHLMDAHPHSAMVMDMDSFEVIAKGRSLNSLNLKVPHSKNGGRSLIFQKPSEKVTWIL